jgi:prepilin-type processing-associated H-X9-DG protein
MKGNAGGYWFIDSAAPQLNGGTQAAALVDMQGQLRTNSLLGPYLPNPGVNHCPGDVRFGLPIGSGSAIGWAYDSYAVTENVTKNESGDQNFTKLSQITRTADCMVFVEQADSRGYNEGGFASGGIVTPNFYPYEDLFATYHGNVGTFAFADGHGEGHKWTDATITRVGKMCNSPGTVYAYNHAGIPQPAQQGTVDQAWLSHHWISPSNPSP